MASLVDIEGQFILDVQIVKLWLNFKWSTKIMQKITCMSSESSIKPTFTYESWFNAISWFMVDQIQSNLKFSHYFTPCTLGWVQNVLTVHYIELLKQTFERNAEMARRDSKSSCLQDLCLALKNFIVLQFKVIQGA